MEIPLLVKEELKKCLSKDEEILYSFKGLIGSHLPGVNSSIQSGIATVGTAIRIGHGPMWASPWLIITEEKVIIVCVSLFSSDIKEFLIKDIESVDYAHTLTENTLTFHCVSSVGGIQFNSSDDKYASKFPQIIRDLIEKNVKSHKSNIDNPLSILKVRYAKGEITRKEYNQMKKEITSS